LDRRASSLAGSFAARTSARLMRASAIRCCIVLPRGADGVRRCLSGPVFTLYTPTPDVELSKCTGFLQHMPLREAHSRADLENIRGFTAHWSVFGP
jgi:hypothetical protein